MRLPRCQNPRVKAKQPRGVLTLVTAAKARAVMYGRYHATVGDVQAMARPALRHRIAGYGECDWHDAKVHGVSSAPATSAIHSR